MATISVTFTHHANTLGMVEIFKPAVESLFADRMTGASAFGAITSTRAKILNQQRFYAYLPFDDGGAVTLLSTVDLANGPIVEPESLTPSEHTLIVTGSNRADALAIAGQVIDLLGPETVDEPKLNADPFAHNSPDRTPIAWIDADDGEPLYPAPPSSPVTIDDVRRMLDEIRTGGPVRLEA